MLLQARGHVDGVPAHHQLAACGRLASRDDLARVDADPEPHLGVVAIEHALGERSESVADGQCRTNGALGVVLVRLRDPEHGEHRVAGELLGRAAVALDLGVDQVEELALELAHVLGVEPLAERGRAREVGEEDGHDSALLRSSTASGSCASGVPQAEQKAAATDCSEPQEGHVTRSDAPHELQKRSSGAYGAPHEGHARVTRRAYAKRPVRYAARSAVPTMAPWA